MRGKNKNSGTDGELESSCKQEVNSCVFVDLWDWIWSYFNTEQLPKGHTNHHVPSDMGMINS